MGAGVEAGRGAVSQGVLLPRRRLLGGFERQLNHAVGGGGRGGAGSHNEDTCLQLCARSCYYCMKQERGVCEEASGSSRAGDCVGSWPTSMAQGVGTVSYVLL